MPLCHLSQGFTIPITPYIPITFVHPSMQLVHIPLIPLSRLTIMQQTTFHTCLNNLLCHLLDNLDPFSHPFIFPHNIPILLSYFSHPLSSSFPKLSPRFPPPSQTPTPPPYPHYSSPPTCPWPLSHPSHFHPSPLSFPPQWYHPQTAYSRFVSLVLHHSPSLIPFHSQTMLNIVKPGARC